MGRETPTAISGMNADATDLPERFLLQGQIGGLGGLGGPRRIANPFLVDPALVDALKEFAKSRGILVDVHGWESKALILAAAAHLGDGKRSRGHPKKAVFQSELSRVLGLPGGLDGVVLELVSTIDADDSARIGRGLKPRSDRYWAKVEAKKTSTEESPVFDQNVSKWQKRIGAARATFGKPKQKM